MAIQVGRAVAVVQATDVATTNIDVNVGFTPVAGEYFVLVSYSGASSATDATGSSHLQYGMGWAVSTSSRRGIAGKEIDATAEGHTAQSSFDDAVIKGWNTTLTTATLVGALDFGGEITNGVRFTVDEQFGSDIRFQVLVIDGLSDVSIDNILEPAATGQAAHTIGVSDPDLLLFMGTGFNTTIPRATTQANLFFGAAHADGQVVTATVARDNQVTMDTGYYSLGGECIAVMGVTGTLLVRASYVSVSGTSLTLDWLARTQTNDIYFCAALKGIGATVQESLTQTDTTTDIVVTGLGDTCLGGLVVSCCGSESSAGTSNDHLRWSVGTFTGTSARGAHGVLDEHGTILSESATSVEYDAVYTNISTADASDATMDIKSMDADGATFIMDDADSSQKWFGAILFSEAAGVVSIGVDEMMAAAQMGAMPVMVARRLRALGYSVEPPSIAHSQVNDISWLPVYPSTIKITYEATPSGEQV